MCEEEVTEEELVKLLDDPSAFCERCIRTRADGVRLNIYSLPWDKRKWACHIMCRDCHLFLKNWLKKHRREK